MVYKPSVSQSFNLATEPRLLLSFPLSIYLPLQTQDSLPLCGLIFYHSVALILLPLCGAHTSTTLWSSYFYHSVGLGFYHSVELVLPLCGSGFYHSVAI
jgi:hypothetical protein